MLFNLIYTLFTFFQASVSTHPVPQAGRCTRSLRARVRKADAPDAYFYFHMQIPGRLPRLQRGGEAGAAHTLTPRGAASLLPPRKLREAWSWRLTQQTPTHSRCPPSGFPSSINTPSIGGCRGNRAEARGMLRMLQSHIRVSPRLPPSPPPLPSLMLERGIVLGKTWSRIPAQPGGTWGSALLGGTSRAGWGAQGQLG